MDSKRRYSEEEVAEILDHATEAQKSGPHSLSSGAGMTLAELQDIGREVGISSDLIAKAASRLETHHPSASPRREFLGTTVGVGRAVDLHRPLTDGEWGRLVVDLRETFDARGHLREEGSFRQWTNGNLQALLEPSESGERLRLRTKKTGAKESLGMGAAMLGMAPVAYALSVLWGIGGGTVRGVAPLLVLGVTGALLYGVSRFRLSKWGATRQLQMDGVAERLTAAIDAEDGEVVGEDD